MNFTSSDRKKYSVHDVCRYITRVSAAPSMTTRRKELRKFVAWLEWRIGDGWEETHIAHLAAYEAASRMMAREAVVLGKAMLKERDEYRAARRKIKLETDRSSQFT